MKNEAEIIEKLNTHYKEYKMYPEMYFRFLESLNLEELPQEVLEEQLNRLKVLKKQNNNILNSSIITEDLKKFSIGFALAIIICFAMTFNNFSGSFALDVLRKTLEKLSSFVFILASISNGWYIYKLVKDYKNYSREKNRINVFIEELQLRIKEVISSKQELNRAKEKEEYPNKSEELVKQIGEKEIRDRITDIEGRILLLPKEREKTFQSKLQKALAEYKDNSRVPSEGGISLILKSKLACLNDLNSELDQIESSLDNTLFVNEEEFFMRLKLDTENFINFTSCPEFNYGNIITLMQKLDGLLACSEDLIKQIEIQNSFAICFWASIKVLPEQDIEHLLDFLKPEFLDKIILEGERELDNLEQTIDVIGTRAILFNMKNGDNYNKNEYLKELVFYIKEYTTKYKTRTRVVTAN